MPLGQDIAPHIPVLRRYGLALLGTQEAADQTILRTLEGILADSSSFRRHQDARAELFRLFRSHMPPSGPIGSMAPGSRTAAKQQIARRRLAVLSGLEREALLLRLMEGFDSELIAEILDIELVDVEALVESAVAALHRQIRADILIVEDEPIIAMDIETTLREAGHNVIKVAVTLAEAVEWARHYRPDLITMDIQLADDSSGIDAARLIAKDLDIPIIFITAFPERLLNSGPLEPTYLITKPFHRATVVTSVLQALFFDTATLPPPEEQKNTGESVEAIPFEMVAPRPGPVDARVVNDRLVLVDNTPAESATEDALVEAARRLHLKTARRLCASLAGSNVGPGFSARLEAVRRILSHRVTKERGLQLALEARGLEAMVPAVWERLDDVTAADVGAFVADLTELTRQFPHYRTFVDEALAFEAMPDERRRAAADLAQALERQPSETVQPELQQALANVRRNVQDLPDKVADLALLRSVGNAFRAVGRSFNSRLKAVASKAADTFDRTAGKLIGSSLALLVVGGPIAILLRLLAIWFPSEFRFVSHLIKVAEKLL